MRIVLNRSLLCFWRRRAIPHLCVDFQIEAGTEIDLDERGDRRPVLGLPGTQEVVGFRLPGLKTKRYLLRTDVESKCEVVS